MPTPSKFDREKFIKDAKRLFAKRKGKSPHVGIYEAAELQGIKVTLLGLSKVEMEKKWWDLLDCDNTKFERPVPVVGVKPPVKFDWVDEYRIEAV